MQSYGITDEWTTPNFNLENYFVTVNKDPYSKHIELTADY